MKTFNIYYKNNNEKKIALFYLAKYSFVIEIAKDTFVRDIKNKACIKLVKTSSPDFHMQQGNKKYRNNKKVRFLIFSIMAVFTRPFATCECIKNCYAKRAARYPNVVANWINNYLWTLRSDFVTTVISYIKSELARKCYKNKKVVIRIHESGDFYSKEYFEKWLQITDYFKGNENVYFPAYTKSVDYIDTKPESMVVRYSIWNDTLPEQIEKAKKLGLTIYSAVESFVKAHTPKVQQCDCADCGTCFKCFLEKFKVLLCEIH